MAAALVFLLLVLDGSDYPWIPSPDDSAGGSATTLLARFPVPPGFTRVAVADGSYAAWLRGLPVLTDRTTVLAYDGRALDRPAAAVVRLDVGDRDLQQCADTAIRLHAEYLWHAGRADAAAYHFTSGDRTAWRDWVRGERLDVRGARVVRHGGGVRAATHDSYRSWLTQVFRYAGTRSLALDSDAVPADRALEAGDFFVEPGGPGHAVVLLDVAERPDGRRAALVGQGYIPAEELHVLRSGALDGVWFPLPDATRPTLDTPMWRPFRRDQARRFR